MKVLRDIYKAMLDKIKKFTTMKLYILSFDTADETDNGRGAILLLHTFTQAQDH